MQFWGLHAALVGSAGLLLLAIKLVFGKLLLPRMKERLDPGVEIRLGRSS